MRDGSEDELLADQSYWLAPDAPALMPLAADGALIAPVLLPASAPAPLLLSARLQPAPPIVSIAIAVITMTFLKFGFIAESPHGSGSRPNNTPPLLNGAISMPTDASRRCGFHTAYDALHKLQRSVKIRGHTCFLL
ncbi:hypothetical protein [Paraburkholderia sp. RL17-347-BIC-D]|uniref:hypothetical protein n=1 Tax=Paraburkholderia sp. RL17-347-BIC-D TaxID=3031632 RepID=UPI0038B95909